MSAPLLRDVIDLLGSNRPGPPKGDVLAWQAFEVAFHGLTAKVQGDPEALAGLRRLVTAEHELRPDEIRRWLEYLWSHLVNKYQGALAEYLAERELGTWLSEQVASGALGGNVLFVPGDTIRERRPGATGDQWVRGADGLLVVDDERKSLAEPEGLLIAGVVEVKSFPTSFARIERQIEAHVSRLMGGLLLGDTHYPADSLAAARWDREQGWLDGVAKADWRQVQRVLICPRRSVDGRGAAEGPGDAHHLIELPVSKATMAAAAYEMTARFLENVGAGAFATGSPWQEMTAEEAAVNAVKEALYHILYEDRAGSPHATKIAKRLYNVYGFGYVQAEGHREMLWADAEGEISSAKEEPCYADEPAPGMALKDLVEGAWHHYRRGALPLSLRWAHAAFKANSDRRVQWLLGMAHYYSGEFQRACEKLPDPGPRPNPDDGWWAKNMLTLARASARCGQVDRAAALVERVACEDVLWSDLPVALPVAEGWVALGRGDHRRAEELLAHGVAAIEALRRAKLERSEAQLGDPPYHDPGAVQIAVVDAATLMSALGRPADALALLRPVAGLFRPLLELVAVDPALEHVRSGPETQEAFAAWLEDRRRE